MHMAARHPGEQLPQNFCSPGFRMNSLFLLLLVLLFSKDFSGVDGKKWKGEGTTPNLDSIIIGRCYEYIRIVNPAVGEKNCSELLEAFKKAFMNKDPCNILPSDYELFINLSQHSIPPNKSLFWENNQFLVSSYAARTRRYMPLGDTLIGAFGDLLNWCGQANNTEVDDSCPTTEECENNAVESFWRIASINYAKQSSGIIHVMLNGSATGGAYPLKGFFADFEIPNLQKERISQIEIWVMDDIGGPDLDSCGKGSVQTLETQLKEMGYDITCIDNYKSVLFLLCLDHPDHPSCPVVSSALSAQRGCVFSDQGGSWNRLTLISFAAFVLQIHFNLLNQFA
ncbi:ADP-ribosyl cyclase 2 isoform C [Alligator mississippiensis]|uniref:ADP-ribosyl cyclase/cyclic ADP-ribose hydrolase n=1 Tax=Alligator mississippiensis TaxID=8496 RepID=A0A151PA39_ALLMI|nr:ADP-ribosyl cyclase 2 isoform C [Alligator mississippiensis]